MKPPLLDVELPDLIDSAAAPANALDHAERQPDGLGNALLGPLDASATENARMVGERIRSG